MIKPTNWKFRIKRIANASEVLTLDTINSNSN